MSGVAQVPDQVDRIQAEWRRERPDIDVAPQGLIGRLHRLANALTAEIVAVYDRFGLSEGEFDVLCALRRAGPPYQRQPVELARSTMVTTGGITKRLDRLEAAGLVERLAAPGDGRMKIARLTPAGRRVIDDAFGEHMANEARLVGALDPEERAALEGLLRSWAGALDSQERA